MFLFVVPFLLGVVGCVEERRIEVGRGEDDVIDERTDSESDEECGDDSDPEGEEDSDSEPESEPEEEPEPEPEPEPETEPEPEPEPESETDSEEETDSGEEVEVEPEEAGPSLMVGRFTYGVDVDVAHIGDYYNCTVEYSMIGVALDETPSCPDCEFGFYTEFTADGEGDICGWGWHVLPRDSMRIAFEPSGSDGLGTLLLGYPYGDETAYGWSWPAEFDGTTLTATYSFVWEYSYDTWDYTYTNAYLFRAAVGG